MEQMNFFERLTQEQLNYAASQAMDDHLSHEEPKVQVSSQQVGHSSPVK